MKRKSTPVGIAARVLLPLVSLVALFLVGELVARTLGGVRYGGWGDPASIRLVSSQFQLNTQGLRDYEIPVEKSAGETRVLCLGDSFTWGQMVELDETYAKCLERDLRASMPGRKLTVINSGRLGWNTADEYEWFLREGVRYEPDVVVVGFCLNDAEEDHYALARLLPENLEKKFAWSYFYFFLKYRVHLLKVKLGITPGYTEYILSLYSRESFAWKKAKRALRMIAETAQERGAHVLVAVFPIVSDWETYPFTPVHEDVMAFCESRAIPALDLLDAFRTSPLPWEELRVGPADRHPSAEGHRIIADGIAGAIRPMLAP
ncbi:MAG: SGNH/GDSL hydrolase family protein [Gemmatimonadetes bacterium]|nr:SGNH/GDSL hydrolase family protein [Gemmatimonadota bacterium]